MFVHAVFVGEGMSSVWAENNIFPKFCEKQTHSKHSKSGNSPLNSIYGLSEAGTEILPGIKCTLLYNCHMKLLSQIHLAFSTLHKVLDFLESQLHCLQICSRSQLL